MGKDNLILKEMIDQLKIFIEIETPSQDKNALDQLGAAITSQIQQMGGVLKIYKQENAGNHIAAKWGKGVKGILILCHMDTVFPVGTILNMPFHQERDKIFGPGVLDMKGGIVVAINAVKTLQLRGEMPDYPITILFTSDEESGSHTSRSLIEKFAGDAAMVFVLESALVDGSLKIWRKGVGGFTVSVKGQAAHAGGDHHKGRNAIQELAHQIIKIQQMTDYDKGTTLNVGVVRGGSVSNVVPDKATASVDVRVLQSSEWTRVEQAMLSLEPVLSGTSIIVDGELNRPPMPESDMIRSSFDRAYQIGKSIGLVLKPGGSGGGSDANFVAALGIPVLDGLGPIGEGYHSEKEYIITQSLVERTKLLASLLRDWKKGD